MTPEQLDEARAKEAWRIWNEEDGVTDEGHAVIAARLARENWTPTEPVVDPDLLAFREWGAGYLNQSLAGDFWCGDYDGSLMFQAYLAGASMAREQERKRTDRAFKDLDEAKREARKAMDTFEDGGRD